MVERKRIGVGWEHEVFKSKVDGWVLKRPKPVTVALLRLFFTSPSDVLKQELDYNCERLERSSVKFPETRIFTINDGYLIAQRTIHEDDSLKSPDIRRKLEETGDQYLLDLYQESPSNFVCNNGDLYCLDLSFSFNRYPDKLGIMSVIDQKHLIATLSQKLSKLMGVKTVPEMEPSSLSQDAFKVKI